MTIFCVSAASKWELLGGVAGQDIHGQAELDTGMMACVLGQVQTLVLERPGFEFFFYLLV